MRIRELFYILGIKPNYRFFGFVVDNISVKKFKIKFANWLAPKSNNLSIESSELDELEKFLKEGDFAIDIGAHIGDSTIPIALICGTTGLVLALEPNPVTFKILAVNSFLNRKLTNIISLPFAATENECLTQFEYNDPWLSNGSDHSGISKWRHGSAFAIPVNGVNLSALLRDNFSQELNKLRYIKIDVEGHDFEVIKSLNHIIEKYRPYIKFEVVSSTSEDLRYKILKYFTRRGYELRLVVDRKLLYGPVIKNEDIFTKITIDIFAVPLEYG